MVGLGRGLLFSKSRIASRVVLALLCLLLLTSPFFLELINVEDESRPRGENTPTNYYRVQQTANRARFRHADLLSIGRSLREAQGIPLNRRYPVGETEDSLFSPMSSYGLSLSDEMTWKDFAYANDDSAEVVIRIRDTQTDDYSALADLISKDGGHVLNSISIGKQRRAVVADIPFGMLSYFMMDSKVRKLSEYVEPNMRFTADFVPNDPEWPRQWGPPKIEADWAWNTTVGNSSILVAVVDTGVDWNHPDLVENYVALGYDWVNNDPDPMDDHGHGTHVAGVVAATINNNIGIAGLAQVRLMAEKALDESGSGSLGDLANAIVHAVDQGAKIISCSWGSYSDSALLHEAVRYAYDNHVLVVAAAGNDATDEKHYPAAYDEVVAVAATDADDEAAGFSNFGDWVEVGAPGVRIFSTVWNDAYAYKSGTSMATPFVSGVAALIWSQFPDMTQDQVRAQLRGSADDLGPSGFDVHYGYGRINARKAVEQTPPDHDLLVLTLDVPSSARVMTDTPINATVLNMGTSPENNIIVQLLVDGTVADSTDIGFLASGASAVVNFSWNPSTDGSFNITSYIIPTVGETAVWNNALSKQTRARMPQVRKVPNQYGTIQSAIDAAYEGDTILVASGTYRENVWVDKADITLTGDDQTDTIIDGQFGDYVVLVTADHVKISNFTIRKSSWGILLYSSRGHVIESVTVADNLVGIGILYSPEVTLRNSNLIDNTYNLAIDGYRLPDFTHDIDTTNTVDGRPIYYLVSEHDKQIPPDAGYVAAVNSTGIRANGLNLTGNYEGVLLAYTTNSLVEDVNASNNYLGIYLAYSSNNSIRSNTAMVGYAGVALYESHSNNVSDNTMAKNTKGLDLYESKLNTLERNGLNGNGIGIHIEKSNNNTMTDNHLSMNTQGFIIEKSSYSALRNNEMTNNTYNFGVTGSHPSHFIHDIDTSNTVNAKPIYYWTHVENKEIPPDAGYVAVVNSRNVTAKGLNLTNNIQGILLAYSSQCSVENIYASQNAYGIYLYEGTHNTISANTVSSMGERGIELVNSGNNAIENNMIANNYLGLGLWASNQNQIHGNAIENGTTYGVGLYLDSSSDNVLRNNQMKRNFYNFGVYGVLFSDFVNDVDNSNTVNGQRIYYWVSQRDRQVPSDAGYVAIVNSTSIVLKDLKLSNNLQGVLFAYSEKSTVMNVTASNNGDDIYLFQSDNNTITGNTVKNSYWNGIYLVSSHNNTITKNRVTKNSWDSIGLYFSNDNVIMDNVVSESGIGIDIVDAEGNIADSNIAVGNIFGIYAYYSDHNTVVNNTVAGVYLALAGIVLTGAEGNSFRGNTVANYSFGIYLEISSNNNTIVENTFSGNSYGICIGYRGLYGTKERNDNNKIYHNNLIKNSKQALSLNSINEWDDGYPDGGNYWSDYSGVDSHYGTQQNLTGSDGVGDEPYYIDTGNRDKYPLMGKWPYFLADVSFDWKIDMKDISIVAGAFGSYAGHSKWSLIADLNKDGRIDLRDIGIVALNFGKTYP